MKLGDKAKDQTEYLVVGETPDMSERLNVGDRYLLDTSLLELDRGTEGVTVSTKAVLTEQTEAEADTVEGLIGKCLGEPGDGGVMEEDKALGEGQGVGGPRQGEGGAEVCVCPSCGAETEHDKGTPCAEAECPQCGQPMQGRKSLADWAGDLGDEAYKALLGHLAETERLTEEEAGLLAPDELEGLVGAWLETEEGQKVGRRLRQKWVDDLTAWWRDVQDRVADFNEKLSGFFTWAKYEDERETMPDDWASLLGGSKSGFKSFKGKDGQWRWIAWAASAFEDLEGEFFKTKALERYVAEANKRGDHGKLWFYHLPLDMGDADFTALPGESRILLKMGTWADDPFAQKAAVYFNRNERDEGASVGYRYRPKDREDKAYDWLWIFETSPVPAEKAAFPFSRFDSFGGGKMKITEDQKAKLREVFGDDWTEVLSRVESASKQMEEMGLAYKAMAESDDDLSALLGQMLAEEAFAEKAKANPVQMLKLALGKIKDEAAKGLIQKVIDALEKGGYEYPKPEGKAKAEECEEEYGKPKKKVDEEEEEEEKPKKGKKDSDGGQGEKTASLPAQVDLEDLSKIVNAVKSLMEKVEGQSQEITGLKAMLDEGDDERARQKVAKAAPIVAFKASIAGLQPDDEEKGEKGAQPAVADNLLAQLATGTPLGPRGG